MSHVSLASKQVSHVSLASVHPWIEDFGDYFDKSLRVFNGLVIIAEPTVHSDKLLKCEG